MLYARPQRKSTVSNKEPLPSFTALLLLCNTGNCLMSCPAAAAAAQQPLLFALCQARTKAQQEYPWLHKSYCKHIHKPFHSLLLNHSTAEAAEKGSS
jgi:hypothetical protein